MSCHAKLIEHGLGSCDDRVCRSYFSYVSQIACITTHSEGCLMLMMILEKILVEVSEEPQFFSIFYRIC